MGLGFAQTQEEKEASSQRESFSEMNWDWALLKPKKKKNRTVNL
ncbi:hypothetical protein [Sulfurospirillum sp. 1612]